MLIENAAQLRQQGRNFPGQWQLRVLIADSSQTLPVEQCLRLLPGRRIAVRAQWQGRCVFAKVFFGASALQEYRYERGMIERMAAAAVPAPKLLAVGTVEGGGYIIVSEFLQDAVEFKKNWQALSDESLKRKLFVELVSLQLQLYRSGLYQADAHLDNYVSSGVSSGDRLLVLDAGGVKTARFRSRALFLSNLALLLAQFNWREHDKLCQWAVACLSAGDTSLSTCTQDELHQALLKRWRQRLRKVSDKCLRSCSKVLAKKLPGLQVLCRRQYASDAMLQDLGSLARLDQLMAQGEVLKRGNSATVAKVVMDGREVVIKRYNLKNRWIAFKRVFQTSRARRSWYNAHLLELLGFATPAPIALIEEKVGRFTQRAYLITEWSAGRDFGSAIDAGDDASQYVDWFSDLFRGMRIARLSHGDMKATNFIIGKHGLRLIDLDSMRFHRCARLYERRRQKDVGRFLANWNDSAPGPFTHMVELGC